MAKLHVILVCTAALTLSAAANAQRPGQRPGGMETGAPPAMQVVQHLHRALRQLDLSEDQQAAIREALQSLHADLKPLWHELMEGRAIMHELVTAENYDADAVAELAAAQGEATAQMIQHAAATVRTALDQLSEEQHAELAAMRERHRARMAEHLERLQDRLGRQNPGS